MWVNIYADNRPETIKNIIIWAAVALFIGYQALNAFVPNAEMILYVRILDASCTAGALYIFAKDAWVGLFRSPPKPRDFLIVGIWLKFASAWAIGVYAILFRISGEPTWLLNNELLPWFLIISIIAVICHACTPGTVDGVVPRRNQYVLAVSIALAFLAVGVFGVSKPDVRPWLDHYVKPYISDWWRTNGDASLWPISWPRHG